MKFDLQIVAVIAAVIFLSAGLSSCEERGTNTSTNGVSMEKWEYSIDGKAVSADVFKKEFDGMKEVPGTWFCAETKQGGITGYDMKDSLGKVYSFRAVSEPGMNRNSLSRKDLNIE